MTACALSDSTVMVAAGDVLVSDFGGELVLLNLRDGVYYGLDDVGARIWALLKRPVTLAVIRNAVVAEYDVDPELCNRDVRSLVGDLAAKGLVEVLERR
jgi:hypothetical protein